MNQPDLVTTTSIADGVIVAPKGDVDLGRSPVLRAALAEASKSRPKRLVVDLSLVPYMDSSGVATLVEGLQVARRNGTTLLLAALQPRVRSILEIARLDTVFRIVDSTDAAQKA